MTQLQWTPPTPSEVRAADETTELIVQAIATERGVHSETAISAAARLAGTFLFHSFLLPEIKTEPGTVVLSDAANDRGPLLVRTLAAGLSSFGFTPSSADLPENLLESHKPQIDIAAMRERLESRILAIACKHGLTDEQTAHACALAAARLIHMSAYVLDPHIGFSLALLGFVEGSKTMPSTRNNSSEQPWYRFW
jgi:hypothetical protein